VQIEYTGRKTDVPPALKTLTERKLKKLERVLGRITHVHVVLAADKRRQSAEVSVNSPHVTLTASDEGADLGLALATVVEKLTRQAQRHVGKLRQRKRRAARAAVARGVVPPSRPPASAPEAPRVIRRRQAVRPMSLDAAAREFQRSGDGFFLFRDAASEKIGVLFRRKDGNLGLIEPEA
jgi:putative sigma-54 modulation protein